MQFKKNFRGKPVIDQMPHAMFYNAVVRLRNRKQQTKIMEANMSEEVVVNGPSIKNTCWKCANSLHWMLRNQINCAKYSQKPHSVYFEGKECPYFDKVDRLDGQPDDVE